MFAEGIQKRTKKNLAILLLSENPDDGVSLPAQMQLFPS
jgi:hypothetical protein